MIDINLGIRCNIDLRIIVRTLVQLPAIPNMYDIILMPDNVHEILIAEANKYNSLVFFRVFEEYLQYNKGPHVRSDLSFEDAIYVNHIAYKINNSEVFIDLGTAINEDELYN